MASYVVMEPPAKSEAAAIDGAVLIRDGFSFPAFAIAPLWLLWHRLWIEAGLAFAAGLAIVELAERAGLGMAGTGLSLLVSLFVGLEGRNLRVAALRRRGWREWGTVDAASAADAEARYAVALAGDEEPGEPVPDRRSSTLLPSIGPLTAGPALGLLGYPVRNRA